MIKNDKYIYIGCFVEADYLWNKITSLDTDPLEKLIANPHVTFAYKPEYVDKSIFGTEVIIRIIGYGRNEENEGVKIIIESDNDKINEMYKDIAVPHITLSISQKGKAVNTRYLDFIDVNPIELRGVFGGFTYNKTVEFE